MKAPRQVDARAPLWRRLANAQLASTLLAAAYVYVANGREPGGTEAAMPTEVRFLAAGFRTAWSYVYVRHFLAPSVNRVLSWRPGTRALRLGASLAESTWAQLVDALFFWMIGAEVLLAVLPFVATNAVSIFLAAEASANGHPPDHVAHVLESRLRAVWRSRQGSRLF